MRFDLLHIQQAVSLLKKGVKCKEWTKSKVIKKMEEIRDKGFISVPKDMFRKDDGIVGQILEREFGVAENNLHLAD